MRFEIIDIEPVEGNGTNGRDVVVEVHYWFGKGKPPDFVQHIFISNVPAPADFTAMRVKTDAMGMIVMKDGSVRSPFVELDGRWVRWSPDETAEWEPDPTAPLPPDFDELVLDAVRGHARQAKRLRRIGRDTFEDAAPDKKPRKSLRLDHPGRDEKVRRLKNHAEDV